jgi:hypothetical protein
MNNIVIEDAFNPQEYLASIVEPTYTNVSIETDAQPKAGVSIWLMLLIGFIGLGIMALLVVPLIEKWIEQHRIYQSDLEDDCSRE